MSNPKISTQVPAGTVGLFVAAAALRLVLFTAFPGLPDILTGRVEISTPATSFKRRKRRPPNCLNQARKLYANL
jgi:hypothetical protein